MIDRLQFRWLTASIAFGLQIKISMHKTNLAKRFKNETQSVCTDMLTDNFKIFCSPRGTDQVSWTPAKLAVYCCGDDSRTFCTCPWINSHTNGGTSWMICSWIIKPFIIYIVRLIIFNAPFSKSFMSKLIKIMTEKDVFQKFLNSKWLFYHIQVTIYRK